MNEENVHLLPQKPPKGFMKRTVIGQFFAAILGAVVGAMVATRRSLPPRAATPTLGHVHSHSHDTAMRRTPVDPVPWGAAFSLHQGEIIEGATKILKMSGQAGLEEDGTTFSSTDMRGQISKALSNIDAVLEGAGMNRSNIVHVRTYTTDVSAFLASYGVVKEWLGEADVMPPHTLLGVAALFVPECKVEIEIEAAS